MTHSLLLSIQYIFGSLNKISREVIHPSESPFDVTDQIRLTALEQKDAY